MMEKSLFFTLLRLVIFFSLSWSNGENFLLFLHEKIGFSIFFPYFNFRFLCFIVKSLNKLGNESITNQEHFGEWSEQVVWSNKLRRRRCSPMRSDPTYGSKRPHLPTPSLSLSRVSPEEALHRTPPWNNSTHCYILNSDALWASFPLLMEKGEHF